MLCYLINHLVFKIHMNREFIRPYGRNIKMPPRLLKQERQAKVVKSTNCPTESTEADVCEAFFFSQTAKLFATEFASYPDSNSSKRRTAFNTCYTMAWEMCLSSSPKGLQWNRGKEITRAFLSNHFSLWTGHPCLSAVDHFLRQWLASGQKGRARAVCCHVRKLCPFHTVVQALEPLNNMCRCGFTERRPFLQLSELLRTSSAGETPLWEMKDEGQRWVKPFSLRYWLTTRPWEWISVTDKFSLDAWFTLPQCHVKGE